MNVQRPWVTLALIASVGGCVDAGVSELDAEVPRSGDDSEGVSSAPRRGGSSDLGGDDGTVREEESPALSSILAIDDPEGVSDGVARTSRTQRLSLSEYARSVEDLLGVSAARAVAEFPPELPTLEGYHAAADLMVTDRFLGALQLSAESLAQSLVNDESAYRALVPCEDEGDACRDALLSELGRRAYRRPLGADELDRYRVLFAGAKELSSSGDAFRDGVRLVVEAMLQSPNFLYRVERGTGVVDEQGELLGDYEVAARLAQLYWGSLPDRELLDAAESGELSSAQGLLDQANRLAADPALVERVTDYHFRWLQMGALSSGGKDPAVFQAYSPELVESMILETARFVERVTLDESGGLSALLTAPYGFADSRLAELYGLEGEFGSELSLVEYSADDPRAGLLTQAAFLSGHSSTSDGTSPILRGVFVLRRLLCQDIPDPPPNAQSTIPPEADSPIVTTRDFFEWKTSMSQCRGCHDQINPVGFAFEDFDGIGRHRSEESGAAIDASGSIEIGRRELSFEGGRQLAEQIAGLPEAQACYARNWLRYLTGRPDTMDDLRTLAKLRLGLEREGYGVRDLLRDVASSAGFRRLSADEL